MIEITTKNNSPKDINDVNLSTLLEILVDIKRYYIKHNSDIKIYLLDKSGKKIRIYYKSMANVRL